MFGHADPLKMQILSGSFRTDHAALPLTAIPACPDYLDGIAKAKWIDLCHALGDAGVLPQANPDAMAMYCTAFSQWREAADMVKKSGLVIKGASGVCANPCVKIAAAAKREMRELSQLMGIGRSSCNRLKYKQLPIGSGPQHTVANDQAAG